MTSTNCLKVILNSSAGVGTDYSKTFQALTQQNDIIYNEFFNHIRKNNLPVKMLLTGCITTILDYKLTVANPFVPSTKNPYYVRVQFNGLTAKNEVSSTRNVEFIVPTMIANTTTAINAVNYTTANPVMVQWLNLPKSNKNIGIELNDNSIFNTPLTIRILDNNGLDVVNDALQGYAPHFTIEFWLFYDE